MVDMPSTVTDKIKNISPIKYRKGTEGPEGKEVTIGLDFGTSTTKCVISIESDQRKDDYYAIQFPARPEPTFFYPTAISYNDGMLYFGDLAAQVAEKNTIYSCKMAIPCRDSWHDFQSPFMWSEEPGSFLFRGDSLFGFSAVELSILYLSHVIRIIKDLVPKNFPDYTPTYSLNMACPLDQLEKDYFESVEQSKHHAADAANRKRDEYIEHSYRAISQYSLALSSEALNPWNIKDANRCLSAVMKQPLQSLEQSKTSVIPETLAAISSFIKRPGTEQGRYMTIDVGAGTTDISVFWLQKNLRDVMPHYYSSGSLHVGVDQFDIALRNVLDSYEGASLRDRRLRLVEQEGGLSKYRENVQDYLLEMLAHRRKCFGRAYYKETKQRLWGNRERTDVKMVFCGGGSNLEIIKKEFAESIIAEGTFGRASYFTPDLEMCRRALTQDNSIVDIKGNGQDENNLNLLLIAEGLASKVIDIPEYGIETSRIHIPPRTEIEYSDY